MLDYPEDRDGILAACGCVGGYFLEHRIGPPPDPFAGFVEASTLSRLQETYVATFDFNPAVAPYLGHHLFGDHRKKGAYLIRLKQEFARHGFVPSGNELPDHLPLVLGFLGHLARISHQASAAAADTGMSTALRSVGLLDVVSTTPAGPSVATPCIHTRLHRLATNPGEKCGLAERGDDGDRRSFLSECVLPGVERLAAGFAVRADSPWKAVVEATGILCAADARALEEETPC
jgi:hypothetical protein